MLRRIKNFLGIEGVKLKVEVPQPQRLKDRNLEGTVYLYSKTAQVIDYIELILIEKYARGRMKSKLINEYVLGDKVMDETLFTSDDEQIEIPFTLPFSYEMSEMDELQNKNSLLKPLIRGVKAVKGVKSQYRLEVKAKVKGQVLLAETTVSVSLI